MSYPVLKDHKRYAGSKEGKEVGDEKGSSSILVAHIGESPDVAQANSRPYGGHDKGKAGSPMIVLRYDIASMRIILDCNTIIDLSKFLFLVVLLIMFANLLVLPMCFGYP